MDIRVRAVQTLGKIGADAVPVLVDALADKNVDVRQNAAMALAPLRISDKMVVLALAHAVHDSDQKVRQQSLQALQLLGTGAKLAAPKLIAALKDSDGPNRLQILNVLQGLGEGEKETLQVAAGLLKDANAQVRQSAVNLLSMQGIAALPFLIEALKDGDQNVRFTAVSAIQRIPGDIKDALPALVPLLKEGPPFQRRSVVLALGRVGAPAVPHLIDVLKDGDGFLRTSAITALQGIGADAKKAVPTLTEMALKETNANTRGNAVRAVAAIDSEKLGDLFAQVKKHNDEKVRLTAYQALAFRAFKKGPVATLPVKVAMPHLIDATKDSAANIRVVGLQGIGNYGADAKNAVPAVTALLDDADVRVRNQAQATLNLIKAK
jgi:HEAT repeat protein